jgi:hypothetical protein
MVVSFSFDDSLKVYKMGQTKIKVHNGGAESNDFCSSIIQVNLEEYLSEKNTNVQTYRVPDSIWGAVKYCDTPEWYGGTAFRFIEETIEGQHLLEKILSDFGSVHKLDLPKPKCWADRKHHINEVSDLWSDSVNYDKLSIDDIDFELSGSVFDTYIYTLRLVDVETDEEVLYVGKSTNITSRIRTHINQGGDFSYASMNKLVVLDLISIKPQSQITEREQYDLICSENPNSIVCGGK